MEKSVTEIVAEAVRKERENWAKGIDNLLTAISSKTTTGEFRIRLQQLKDCGINGHAWPVLCDEVCDWPEDTRTIRARGEEDKG